MRGRTASTSGDERSVDTARRPVQLARLHGELRLLQQQLQEQGRLNAMLRDSAEQFIATVAHDLKNPLAAIKINVQGLKRWCDKGVTPTPEQWAERLERIEISVQQVLEQMAAARSRMDLNSTEQLPLNREPVDAVALVRQVFETYRQVARQHHLRFDCGDSALMGVWDAERLRVTLERVVDNAIKFSPGGGDVSLSLARQETDGRPCAVVQVRDTGIGIPTGDLPHVFEHFYRAENVVGRFKGAGLGLFEADLDIRRHDGSIDAESTLGSGSLFTIRLPLQA